MAGRFGDLANAKSFDRTEFSTPGLYQVKITEAKVIQSAEENCLVSIVGYEVVENLTPPGFKSLEKEYAGDIQGSKRAHIIKYKNQSAAGDLRKFMISVSGVDIKTSKDPIGESEAWWIKVLGRRVPFNDLDAILFDEKSPLIGSTFFLEIFHTMTKGRNGTQPHPWTNYVWSTI